jgi:hypothetical protein
VHGTTIKGIKVGIIDLVVDFKAHYENRVHRKLIDIVNLQKKNFLIKHAISELEIL